jgi:hypothetical protein
MRDIARAPTKELLPPLGPEGEEQGVMTRTGNSRERRAGNLYLGERREDLPRVITTQRHLRERMTSQIRPFNNLHVLLSGLQWAEPTDQSQLQ